MKKWYYNAYTGEIESYVEEGTLTDFPRGVYLAYNDYLTTGFDSREQAEKWAKEWGKCSQCKSIRKANEHGCCNFCGSKIEFPQDEINHTK